MTKFYGTCHPGKVNTYGSTGGTCMCVCVCAWEKQKERCFISDCHMRFTSFLPFPFNMLMFWTSTVIIVIHIPLQGFCRPKGLFFITVCPYSVYVKVWICELALCELWVELWRTFNRKRQAYSWRLVSFSCGLVFNVDLQRLKTEFYMIKVQRLLWIRSQEDPSGLQIWIP